MTIPSDHEKDFEITSYCMMIMKVFAITKEDMYLKEIH